MSRKYEAHFSTILAEITFEERKSALQQKREQDTRTLPAVTQHRPPVQILIQN